MADRSMHIIGMLPELEDEEDLLKDLKMDTNLNVVDGFFCVAHVISHACISASEPRQTA